ncbi:MAG TPA: preprotein translocase subunit SecE [Candidatus Saccharimonadales bacterium]|nr:preprotein translocase subunit SecE [Candidatus Saccharimonadales bacterium]
MSKNPKEATGAKKANVLKRRIELAKGKTLGRDVRSPRWLTAIGAYFKGAVTELRQVKWPNRKATWSFTLAVIVFTLAMTAFILALDFGFEQLFKQVIL